MKTYIALTPIGRPDRIRAAIGETVALDDAAAAELLAIDAIALGDPADAAEPAPPPAPASVDPSPSAAAPATEPAPPPAPTPKPAAKPRARRTKGAGK